MVTLNLTSNMTFKVISRSNYFFKIETSFLSPAIERAKNFTTSMVTKVI